MLLLALLLFLYKYIKKCLTKKPILKNQKIVATDYDVCIVGSGPVGKLLAISCLQKGLRTIILEQEQRDANWSNRTRAIGIHPTLLDKMDTELVQQFVQASVVVRKGICLGVQGKNDVLGVLDFAAIRKPHNFVLSCAQQQSMHILQTFLEKQQAQDSSAKCDMQFEATVQSISSNDTEASATVHYMQDQQGKSITSRFVVACDGSQSALRQFANIPLCGETYKDWSFVMGDFKDNTEFADTAAIFLSQDGLCECFPLRNGWRRWVCSANHNTKDSNAEELKQELMHLVLQRTKIDISQQEHSMLSCFGVQGFYAKRYFDLEKRLILCGDSAHVCSPLGGQGMNVGWLDAIALAESLHKICKLRKDEYDVLQEYEETQQVLAIAAIKRAEMNMRLGKGSSWAGFRNKIVVWLLYTRLGQYLVGSFFTMRWLGSFALFDKIFA